LNINLAGIDLIKPLQQTSLEEVRNVNTVNVVNKRSVVENSIPGRQGNVLQDMGIDAVHITIIGEIFGKNAKNTIEQLIEKYQKNEPMVFSSDISSIVDVTKVLIERLEMEQLEGSPFRFNYFLLLTEYIVPK